MRRIHHAWTHILVQSQLKNSTDYSYTCDWFSMHVSNWQTCLAPLMGRRNIQVLEIGSFEGRSAVWLLEHVLSHSTSTITCIDPFCRAGQEARFDHNIALTRRAQQLTKIKGFSGDVLVELTDSCIDLIYIDGSHQAGDVLLDAFLSWSRLKPGGILIFDDYLLTRGTGASQRPKLAIDLFLGQLAGRYQHLHAGYQMIIRKNES